MTTMKKSQYTRPGICVSVSLQLQPIQSPSHWVANGVGSRGFSLYRVAGNVGTAGHNDIMRMAFGRIEIGDSNERYTVGKR